MKETTASDSHPEIKQFLLLQSAWEAAAAALLLSGTITAGEHSGISSASRARRSSWMMGVQIA